MIVRLKKTASICLVILLVAVPVLAGSGVAPKPQQPPAYVEPTGDLVMTSSPQLVLKVPGYVRVYDWKDGKFGHTWSGIVGDTSSGAAVIGDVDNDGIKEVVASGTLKEQLKGNKYSYTYFFKVWNDGDASDSPSISLNMGHGTGWMEIGDVDGCGDNELVISCAGSDGTAEVWSCTEDAATKEATISNLGYCGVTVADSDNDGISEIIMGQGIGDYSNQPVIADYADGEYSIIPLPMASKAMMDEVSVGDLDGVAGNELFGSGISGMHIWQYYDGEYTEIWAKDQGDYCMNNEIADINGDGKNEFAFTTSYAANLIVYKYDGETVWSKLGTYDGALGGVSDSMVSADLDNDDKSELVLGDQVWDWDGSAMKMIQDLTDKVSLAPNSLA